MAGAATALAGERGADSLTLANVAARTGAAAPSLYKHVHSLAALRTLVSLRILEEVSAAAAGRSGGALAALIRAYHRYVTEHPNRYALFPQQPASDPRLAAAAQRLVDIMLAVLCGYGSTGRTRSMSPGASGPRSTGSRRCGSPAGSGCPGNWRSPTSALVRMVVAGLHDCATGS